MSDPLYFDELTRRRLDELQSVLERVATGLEKITDDKPIIPVKETDLLKVLISAQMFCEQSNCGLCMEAIKAAQNLTDSHKCCETIDRLKKIVNETEESMEGNRTKQEVLIDLIADLKCITGQL